jgi:hypothetical protein
MTPFEKLRQYLSKYLHFVDQRITVPLSYWIAATYLLDVFDAFPYLVVTARTKRAGKTRLAELISFTCQMPFPVTAATPSSIFRKMTEKPVPTVIYDEAEKLSSNSATVMRQFLNSGYRKGQTIPRNNSMGGVDEFPTYSPKVFVLIGDVYDTLRDRSIIVEMERAPREVMEQKSRFHFEISKKEGEEIAKEIKALLSNKLEDIERAYLSETLGFLTDRDEEIWRPIFAICRACEDSSYTTLQSVAADMAADKTNPNRYIESKEQETRRQIEEYSLYLLRDAYLVCQSYSTAIPSADLLQLVRDIPTSPWRKYHSPSEIGTVGTENGSGLTIKQMASMLSMFKVSPKVFHLGKNPTFRGYSCASIKLAAASQHVTPKENESAKS